MNNLAFYCDYDNRVKNDVFINGADDNEYFKLVASLREYGIISHTLDVYIKKKIEPDVCLFLDMPKRPVKKIINKAITKSILLIREPPTVIPENYWYDRHKQFDSIITWNEDLLKKGENYSYYPSTRYYHNIEKSEKIDLKEKFLTMIASNINSNLDGELYSERIKIVKFHEERLDQFELYGKNWGQIYFRLFRKNWIKLPGVKKKLKTYKGVVDNKMTVLSKYKFSYCLENTNNINNYISEKIFDCFFAGSIPVYYGAPNVNEIIPKEAYIDYRNFASLEALYYYIENMGDEEYMNYRFAIRDYLNSEPAKRYHISNWINSILPKIISNS